MKKLKTGQQGLLQGFLLWAVLELNDALSYGYQVSRNGPYMFNTDGSAVTQWQRFLNHNYYQVIWLHCLLVAMFVELSYHYVFKRKSFPEYLIILLSGAAALVLLNGWWSSYKYGASHLFTFTVPFLVISAYGLIYAFLRDYFQKEGETKNRQIQQKESEINVLKAQVNPHFFFNTLNTIYGTALQENAPRTAKCIEQLSGIMRYTLTGAGSDLTSLSDEINFIEDYLQLQRLRVPHRENITVETAISIDDPSLKIAPLLLLPFIENAFKYGISTEHPCKIIIRLNVKDKVLNFLARNTLVPKKKKPEGLGTGIENVRQRLDLIYPGRHQLFHEPEGPDFKVVLTINLA